MHLNHIGIAVSNPETLKKLFTLLGLSTRSIESVPEQGVQAHFVPVSGPTNFELLEATDPESTIAQFIAKRGPGIHHLSLECAKGELDGLSAKLRASGYRLTYDAPKMGAHHMRVNFIHPASTGGILIEIMETS